jgi:hypothetical protein
LILNFLFIYVFKHLNDTLDNLNSKEWKKKLWIIISLKMVFSKVWVCSVFTLRIHWLMHVAWNWCLHAVSTFTLSSSLKVSKQIGHSVPSSSRKRNNYKLLRFLILNMNFFIFKNLEYYFKENYELYETFLIAFSRYHSTFSHSPFFYFFNSTFSLNSLNRKFLYFFGSQNLVNLDYRNKTYKLFYF